MRKVVLCTIYIDLYLILQGSSQNGHLCGSTLPPVSNTSGNSLYIRFRTDGAGAGKGFKLRYQARHDVCSLTRSLFGVGRPLNLIMTR